MKSNIRILAIILSIFMITALMLPVMSVGAADTLKISSSSAEGKVGDTVQVTLTVESNPGFAALLINIPATDGIEIVEVKNGSVMGQMTAKINILWDSDSNSTAKGTLLTVTLRITDNARVGEHEIKVRTIECYGVREVGQGKYEYDAVNVSIEPIVITVLGETAEGGDTPTAPEVESSEVESSEFESSELESSTDENHESSIESDPTETTEKETNTTEDDNKYPDTYESETETTVKAPTNTSTVKNGCTLSVSGIAIFAAILPVMVVLITKKSK